MNEPFDPKDDGAFARPPPKRYLSGKVPSKKGRVRWQRGRRAWQSTLDGLGWSAKEFWKAAMSHLAGGVVAYLLYRLFHEK